MEDSSELHHELWLALRVLPSPAPKTGTVRAVQRQYRSDHAEYDPLVRQQENQFRSSPGVQLGAGQRSRTRPFSASAPVITSVPARRKTRCSRSIPIAQREHHQRPALHSRSFPRRSWLASQRRTIPNYQPRAYPPDEYTLPEKILSYTASVQQQLPGNAVLTVAYVGSQGRNLFLRSWTNRIDRRESDQRAAPILQYGSQFAQIDYKTSGGTDHYDSMQTTVNRRFAKGLTAGFQWTYAHSIGNTGGSNEAQTTQNPFNFAQDRGNNAFDVRHSANLSLLYAAPRQV